MSPDPGQVPQEAKLPLVENPGFKVWFGGRENVPSSAGAPEQSPPGGHRTPPVGGGFVASMLLPHPRPGEHGGWM